MANRTVECRFEDMFIWMSRLGFPDSHFKFLAKNESDDESVRAIFSSKLPVLYRDWEDESISTPIRTKEKVSDSFSDLFYSIYSG